MDVSYPILMSKAKDSLHRKGGEGSWRDEFRSRLRDVELLTALLPASSSTVAAWRAVAAVYPIAITRYYYSLINPTDPADPIRRQCIPDPAEIAPSSWPDDPLDEEGHMPVPGLIRRYEDRCLIVTTNLCAVYCRHCNRKRRWKMPRHYLTDGDFSAMIAYIKGDRRLREVILSGGDPLVLPDEILNRWLKQLRAIPHVEVIRIGTRVPVVMPLRITKRLCQLLRNYRPLWINTQFNHPREITPLSAAACDLLVSTGIPLSNQSVLLQGVNDQVTTMRELLTGLERISVRPYYLFQCDPVRGTEHFHVKIDRGRALMKELWASLSGLCLPRYVADIPQAQGKQNLEVSFDKNEKIG